METKREHKQKKMTFLGYIVRKEDLENLALTKHSTQERYREAECNLPDGHNVEMNGRTLTEVDITKDKHV